MQAIRDAKKEQAAREEYRGVDEPLTENALAKGFRKCLYDADDVREAVERLGDRAAEMIWRKFYNSETYAEIGRAMGTPERTVVDSIKRSLKKLSESLQSRR
jgi:DNA-directed RNA polymerase specialized sigma24 family protein